MNYRKKGQAPEREAFRAKFQLVDTNLEQGTFRGYASVFGSEVDTWPRTVVDKGAFAKTLAEGMSRIRLLYQHDPYSLIGKPVEMREDDKGLYIVGKISDTQMGKDVLSLLRDGVLEEMSIGFDPIRWEMVPDAGAAPTSMDGIVRHLKEVRLWEVSLVTFAADPMAQVYAVHSLQTAKCPSWEATDALQRVRQWCGFTSDTDDGNTQATHRFAQAQIGGHLVADVEDGQLKLVPLAVFRAGAEMIRARLAAEAQMTPDEARQLIEGTEQIAQNMNQILAAANGTSEPKPDTSADSETQSVARAEATAKRHAAIEHQLIELEAEAALLGVR